MNIKTTESCIHCGLVENHMHVMYFCASVKPIWEWFKDQFERMCDIKCNQPIRTLMLDYTCRTKKQRNTMNILIIEYVNSIWYSKDNANVNDRIIELKFKMMYTKRLLCNSCNIGSLFTDQYVNMSFRHFTSVYFKIKMTCYFNKKLLHSLLNIFFEDLFSIFRTPNHMIFGFISRMACSFHIHAAILVGNQPCYKPYRNTPTRL